MEWTFELLSQLPPSYYRGSAKAIVFDAQKRLLVSCDDKGEWEIPGGGFQPGENVVFKYVNKIWSNS